MVLGEKLLKFWILALLKNISPDSKNQTQLTQAGSFIGTYRYASPEQCRGLPNIDQRSDIYSLGVILYEAISGKNPCNLDNDFSNSQADWIACHIKVPPKPLKEQLKDKKIDDELENMVMKCLAKSPQDRFQNIRELQSAFANSLSTRMGLKQNLIPDTKIINELTENSNQFKTETEVETAPLKTVLETKTNIFSRDPTLRSHKKKLSVGFLATVAAILIGMIVTGGYLLFFKLTEEPTEKPTEPGRTTISCPDSDLAKCQPIPN